MTTTTGTATRTVHRFKLQPDATGVATIKVPAEANLLTVELDLSLDLAAFVDVPVEASGYSGVLRFAVVRTGQPIPGGATYVATRVLPTLDGPVIVHVFQVY